MAVNEILKRARSWLPRGAPPRAVIYRCYHKANQADDHSFKEFTAEQLSYGCTEDRPPIRYASLPEEYLRRIPANDLSSMWIDSTGVLCSTHRGRYVMPRCPLCGNAIVAESSTPGMGIWGLSNSGKTVFCASLYLEVRHRLYALTGFNSGLVFNRGEYVTDVVGPLESEGIVPEKTKEKDYRTVVMRVDHDKWNVSRQVAFTDMAGEVFTFDRDLGIDALRRQPMLRASEAMLLVDPEVSPPLRTRLRPNPVPVVMRLMGLLESDARGVLLTLNQREMDAVIDAVDRTVRDSTFPAPDFVGTGHGYRQLAASILGLFKVEMGSALVTRFDAALHRLAQQMRNVATPAAQVFDFCTYLRTETAQPRDRKINTRLAVTITKADLFDKLPDVQALAKHPWLQRLGPHSSRQQWHDALQRLSDDGRQTLEKLGEGDLISAAERNFRDVGYFFVSSLGRDTKTALIQERRQASAYDQTEASAVGGASQPQAATQRQETISWRIVQRIIPGQMGKGPEPWNVLAPLLWLITAR